MNRNKKSLGLSFQHAAGQAILHKLVKDCDVLVENYLPGALRKYRMDYETVAEINKGIIYASITGYGQTGPYSDRAGYDVMVEACVPSLSLSLSPSLSPLSPAPATVKVSETGLTQPLAKWA